MSFYSRLFVARSPAAFVSAALTTAMLCFAPAAFADRTAADDESHIDDPPRSASQLHLRAYWRVYSLRYFCALLL